MLETFRRKLVSSHEEIAVVPRLEDQHRDKNEKQFFLCHLLGGEDRVSDEVVFWNQGHRDSQGENQRRIRNSRFFVQFLAGDAAKKAKKHKKND